MSEIFIFQLDQSIDILSLVSLVVTALIGVVTILLMWLIFKTEQKNRIKERADLQRSLLNSLFVELNQISSPSNDIRINGKTWIHKGNLEWYEEDILPKYKLQKGIPPHSVWKINISEYLAKLSNKIEGKNVIELKKLIVLLNQKLELIHNYFIASKSVKDIEGVIKESKNIVNEAKYFLSDNFHIK